MSVSIETTARVIELHPLLDTGERALFTSAQRRQLGRCHRCEWHPETQGHHPWCPDNPVTRGDGTDYCTGHTDEDVRRRGLGLDGACRDRSHSPRFDGDRWTCPECEKDDR